ncbi:alpha-(1,3)-fucosyltransferase C-like [Saccostrea echinata]|uniref:alpha-(1,3)-fucosyltransferase C-like n=1 Tax=Saccostrea echinata TaxID=191078 RepID=UPI002A83A6F7|nr:alpha-(1,3)-fucosyltransferase C-like [Saccostrea echinata]XP_061180195.1 alpha-(1,3)-fucosyltransferase C-like [Saccostrea echinata]
MFEFMYQKLDFEEHSISTPQNCPLINKTEWRILWYNIPSYLINALNYTSLKTHEKHPKWIFTYNIRDLSRSDVVIFTHYTMGEVPPNKTKCQIWVFNTMEAPNFMNKHYQKWNNSLDWLMSYRMDSDIYRPYGILKKRATLLVKNYTEVFQKKKYFGVWMSGHCPVPSRRKDYILNLKNYIQVDMFGSCGNAVCLSPTPGLNECLRNFSRDYKFYFAFENNICKYYTTEKLFNIFLGNLDVIPVINGPQNAAEYIPNGTFINALDFPSPQALANKLKEIGSNETLFMQYLREKDKYIEIGLNEIFLQSMFQIFDKINRTNGNIVRRKESIQDHFFAIKKDC